MARQASIIASSLAIDMKTISTRCRETLAMALASLSNPRTKISLYDLAHHKVSGTDVPTKHTTEKWYSDVQMYTAPTLFYRVKIGKK